MFRKEYYSHINEYNKTLTGDNNIFAKNRVNFCHLILPKTPGEISVTCTFVNEYSKNSEIRRDYIRPDGEDADISENYYYGVSPLVDEDEILNLINKLDGNEKYDNILNYYIENHPDWFCFKKLYYEKQKDTEMAIALAKYILVSLINKFKSIKEDKYYKNVFYSGVFLKVLRIDSEERNLIGNDDISTLNVIFEKSTYATVFAFDRNRIKSYKNVCDEKDIKYIEHFFSKQDTAFRNLKNNLDLLYSNLQGKELEGKDISLINNYLAESTFVNHIGVSSMIITSDKYLILCERPDVDYDSGLFYPPANGNAEILDGNVSFYKKSVEDDSPTIDIESLDYQKGFYSEIDREAREELSVELNSTERCILGVTISGIIGSENERRCNFNVLFNHSVDDEFNVIQSKSKESIESFEIKEVYGVKAPYRYTKIDFFVNFLSHFQSFNEVTLAIAVILNLISKLINLVRKAPSISFKLIISNFFKYFSLASLGKKSMEFILDLLRSETIISIIIILIIIFRIIKLVINYSKHGKTKYIFSPWNFGNKPIQVIDSVIRKFANFSYAAVDKKQNTAQLFHPVTYTLLTATIFKRYLDMTYKVKVKHLPYWNKLSKLFRELERQPNNKEGEKAMIELLIERAKIDSDFKKCLINDGNTKYIFYSKDKYWGFGFISRKGRNRYGAVLKAVKEAIDKENNS